MNREHSEKVDLFQRELILCGLTPNEKVVILSEGNALRDYALAFVEAAKHLGSEVEDLNLSTSEALTAEERITQLGKSSLSDDKAAMSTLKEADLVIDLMLLLFSKEQIEIQASGTRILLAVEPFEILQRLFPSKESRQRVEDSEQLLASAKELHFSNEEGTDVVYQLGNKQILTEYGFTDTPGRWDHWPSGFLATMAKPGGVDGRVVMAPGDILLPQMKMLREPISFEISEGRVTKISGDAEASALNGYIQNYSDDRAYAVSHIGWGLNEDAQWTVDVPGRGMDARAHWGNVLFSLGPDIEFGGTNDTQCHLDLPMKNCDLRLDGELVVQKGSIIY